MQHNDVYQFPEKKRGIVTREDCERHIDSLVRITMTDGLSLQAIIIAIDGENITVLTAPQRPSNERVYGGPAVAPGFRFQRLILPLAGIVALSTLPYFMQPYPPYGYFYPYYPYY